MNNIRNFGIAEGRLTRDLVIYTNSDGSRKVQFTITVRDNFTDKNGVRGAQFVNFDGFISRKQIERRQREGKAENGIYDFLHKGDLVAVEYTIRSYSYLNKATGEMVFGNSLLVQNIEIKES